MGIPPFGGFFSKYMVFMGSIQSGHPLITAAFLFGAFLTIIYLFRTFNLIFLGETKIVAQEKSASMLFSVLLLALLSLGAGLLISYPANFATIAAQQMMGVIK